MYSTHTEGKTVVAERFIRTFMKKNYRYMNSVPKDVYINKLADIANKYNNTYHSTIKMKPADVKSSTNLEINKENNKEDSKFKVGGHLRISKCKTIFAKGYVLNLSEEVKKHFASDILVILLVKNLLECFTKNICKN